LPELITAIKAVRKGHGELAVGNIVGADILNVLFVIGSAAAVTTGGLVVPANYYKLQFPAMMILLLVFRFFTKRKGDVITKKEGVILLGLYLVYLVLNYIWI
jgi:cation:H+ antiporter